MQSKNLTRRQVSGPNRRHGHHRGAGRLRAQGRAHRCPRGRPPRPGSNDRSQG